VPGCEMLTFPVRFESTLELTRRSEILAEWLLDDDTNDALLWVAVLLQVLGDRDEDTGRKSHVEDTVVLGLALLNLLQVLVKLLEGAILVICTSKVGTDVTESIELIFNLFGWGLDVGADAFDILSVVHLGTSISHNPHIFGQVLVTKLGEGQSEWRNSTSALKGCLPGQRGQGRSSSLRDHLKHPEQQ
jgi:hypothetical protein